MASRARQRRLQRRREQTIPTEAFSDIAFLLIIFFLLTTTLMKTRGLPLEIPSGEEGEQNETPVVRVVEGRILLDDKRVGSVAGLREKLAAMKLGEREDEDDRFVELAADDATPFGIYLPITDAIQDAGGIVQPLEEAPEDGDGAGDGGGGTGGGEGG